MSPEELEAHEAAWIKWGAREISLGRDPSSAIASVEALFAEVRRLRAELSRAQNAARGAGELLLKDEADVESALEERDMARSELARLRAELSRAKEAYADCLHSQMQVALSNALPNAIAERDAARGWARRWKACAKYYRFAHADTEAELRVDDEALDEARESERALMALALKRDAELRAARAVVEAARVWVAAECAYLDSGGCRDAAAASLDAHEACRAAIEQYDEVTK